jgi:hypothetical protein
MYARTLALEILGQIDGALLEVRDRLRPLCEVANYVKFGTPVIADRYGWGLGANQVARELHIVSQLSGEVWYSRRPRRILCSWATRAPQRPSIRGSGRTMKEKALARREEADATPPAIA